MYKIALNDYFFRRDSLAMDGIIQQYKNNLAGDLRKIKPTPIISDLEAKLKQIPVAPVFKGPPYLTENVIFILSNSPSLKAYYLGEIIKE